MLIGVDVTSPGLVGQRFSRVISSSLPEVDVRPVLVVLPAGAADAVFFCVFH